MLLFFSAKAWLMRTLGIFLAGAVDLQWEIDLGKRRL
jgi:hypothetical protein